jgi:hypothetical protein
MKKITWVAAVTLAAVIPSTLVLAQTPNPSKPPTARATQQKEIKIYISDTGSLPMDESTVLYPPTEWYLSKREGAKSIQEILKEGWNLFQIVPINAKQHYWIFTK